MTRPRPPRTALAVIVTALVATTTGAASATCAAPRPHQDRPQTRCAAPDARPTVVFLDDDTGVRNRVVRRGCTVNDLIDDERTWPRRGRFVAHVRLTTERLVRDDDLTSRQARRLVAAAARSEVGRVPGYRTLFDGSAKSFAHWAYAGDGGFDRHDGMLTSRVGADGGFGTLWYTRKQYADFSLRLQFRDDSSGDTRGNSGVQVRFPDLSGPVEGCPTTINGSETNNLAWIAVNCGHEVQINDSPDTAAHDPRKTGSVYGFADLDLAASRPTPKGTWNDLEVRVVGQHYTVIRNGVVVNEYENVPGVPFPDRPNDPDSSSRGLVGHVGLQAHGSAPDVLSFRNVRVRELD